jgi:hypothetical protein
MIALVLPAIFISGTGRQAAKCVACRLLAAFSHDPSTRLC